MVLCNGFIPVSQRPQSQPWLRMSRYTPHARSCPCHAFAHQSLDRVRPMTTNDTARPKAWNYPLFVPLASYHLGTSREGQWKGERREIQLSKKGINTSAFSSSFPFSHHPYLCIRSSHLHSSIAFPRPRAHHTLRAIILKWYAMGRLTNIFLPPHEMPRVARFLSRIRCPVAPDWRVPIQAIICDTSGRKGLLAFTRDAGTALFQPDILSAFFAC